PAPPSAPKVARSPCTTARKAACGQGSPSTFPPRLSLRLGCFCREFTDNFSLPGQFKFSFYTQNAYKSMRSFPARSLLCKGVERQAHLLHRQRTAMALGFDDDQVAGWP